MLTSRYDEAFRYAHELHRRQTRKGTPIPYISHLMCVSAIVIEHGGNEDQSIGALFMTPRRIRADRKRSTRSGGASAKRSPRLSMTAPTRGSSRNPNGDRARRLTSRTLPAKSPRSLLVSLADKTHNAEAILFDYRALGDPLWQRFNGGEDGTRWYYRALADVFTQALPSRLSDRLTRAVAAFSA